MHALTEKLFKTFTRLDGLKVSAFISTPALGNSQTQKIPYRLMTVRAPILVHIGDVMNAEGGSKAILLEHPADNEWTANFKIAYARTWFDWLRPMKKMDPVTGMAMEDVWVPLGRVYANFDTPLDDHTLTFTETEYRFLTGSDVQVRDKIGSKLVSKVEKVLGVNLVYAT